MPLPYKTVWPAATPCPGKPLRTKRVRTFCRKRPHSDRVDWMALVHAGKLPRTPHGLTKKDLTTIRSGPNKGKVTSKARLRAVNKATKAATHQRKKTAAATKKKKTTTATKKKTVATKKKKKTTTASSREAQKRDRAAARAIAALAH